MIRGPRPIARQPLLPICRLWVWPALLVFFVARGASAETFVERRAAIEREYGEKLEALARSCDGRKLSDEAAAIRAWIPPQRPLTLVVAVPDESLGEAPDGDSPPLEWARRFRALRQEQAKRLFELAQAAAGEREYALAFQLIHATLREDPDHEAARRLLGFKRHAGKWLTPYELAKAQAQQAWHVQFGWLPEKYLSRYLSGERFYRGRWISADDDARLHADIEHGWDILTEHYQVHTNHSLAEGVRLATRLEEFDRVWRQVFVRYYLADNELARLFREGVPPNRAPRRHQVTYFRDRDEYNQALEREQPQIRISTGYYSSTARMAYFFAGPEQNDGNIYHESTHQLFSELRPVKEAGRDANFWIVEGIACFMESYQPGKGLATLGGGDALRLDNARIRLLRDQFYLPLAELCGLGMADLQRHDDIKLLYSQASGLTYFLMFADEGRYRQALVDYLATVYANRDQRETLAELAGTSYRNLDEQYKKFIQHLP